MSIFIKKPLVTIGLLLLLLVGLPATIFLFQQQQETRSRADQTVTISFAPTSTEAGPISVPESSLFPLTMVLNPGASSVSFVKVELNYDPVKLALSPTTPFQVNPAALGTIIEGPIYSPGKILVTLSAGADTTKLITSETTLGTFNFKALQSTAISETNTLVQYGPATQALSTSSNASPTENVIANKMPATIYIALSAIPTPVPGVATAQSYTNPTPTPRPSYPTTGYATPTPRYGSPTAAYATPTPRYGSPTAAYATPTPQPGYPTTAYPTTGYPAGPACGNAYSDSMLVFDKSGSMNDKNGSTGTKMANAQTAAANYVTVVSVNTQNRLGLSTFASTATLNSGMTNDFNGIKSKINALSANGSTCIECGINKANAEIKSNGRPEVKKVVILLTDGLANYVDTNGGQSASTSVSEQRALDAAKKGFSESGTTFYTIGLGNDVNATFLRKIADETGGKYYFSPTGDQLRSVYEEISKVVAKGSISGSVFNDMNGNGAKDANEPYLSGWTLELYLQGSTTPQTLVSDSYGGFNFTGLCDGYYTLKEVIQSGWVKTVPTTDGYSITISNGSVQTNKLFGNKKGSRCSDGIDNDYNGFIDAEDSTCHTDGNPKNPGSYDPDKDGENGGGGTCSDSKDNNGNGLIDGGDPVCHTDKNPNNPGSYDPNLPEAGNTCADGKDNNNNGLIDSADPICHTDKNPNNPGSYDPDLPELTAGKTSFSLKVLLDGIGSRGDNTNPTASTLSNKTPGHPQKSTKVEVYNVNNQPVATGTGMVAYNEADGVFEGTVELGNAITTGVYTVKIQTERYLKKLATGIQNLTSGEANTIPLVALVAGDINVDNRLSILDYNLLLDCYSDLAAAANCDSTAKKTASDINDDGPVNQTDYNLFLREIATQPGE